ncbi:hypothetical protein [Sphingomonas sp. 10B4]|uniref:hypothetical protein n=1 Tax=Sphingomonas sp. 10B4 TaxID=3048575 RepID=UPI002AB5D89C|nr:hypothetical protein [Sphingomonas sp. 10B4]MDY7524497.1 hypothetical protein [Sphingomonas sp. 10B4]
MEYAHTENSFQCRYATGDDGQNNARRPRCGGEAASIGNRFGFADYRGNHPFLSTADLATADRASLFLIDYSTRRRPR